MPRLSRLLRRKRTRKTARRTRKQRGGSTYFPKENQGEPTFDLVVARYKEPIDWLNKYKDKKFHKVYIYNKSKTAVACKPEGAVCEITNLPNVGVCDHTYLYHIVDKYDTLADVTIFLPGSADLKNKVDRTHATIEKAFETKDTVIYGYLNPQGTKTKLYGFRIDRHVTASKHNQELGDTFRQTPAELRPFGLWYETHFPGVNIPYESNAGVFAVSRKHVHLRPKEFYQRLLEQVDDNKFHEASHYIERSWPAIFHPLPPQCFYHLYSLDLDKLKRR
jgi:hypothetical protein